MPVAWTTWATPASESSSETAVLMHVGGGVQVGVDLVGGQPQRGQAGGGGDRVPGQGAGLVDRPLRREVVHHVGAAAERRGREAAAHHLAEGHQVGAPALLGAVETPLAEPGGPEPGHHLVADEQRAVVAAGLGQEAVEPRLGRDHAHVARGGLGDQAGDPVAVLGERLLDRGPVVVGQHQGQLGRRGRYAGRARDGERGDARAGRGQQRVDVAVVAAGELHDHVATGEAAGQPDRRHRGLGAGGDEPDPLDRRAGHDLLGQLHLGPGRRAVRRTASHRRAHRRLDLGVRVAEQHRPPRADQVDVLVAVDVGQPGALGGGDEPGGAADRVERPHRGVDAARGHGQRPRRTARRTLGIPGARLILSEPPETPASARADGPRAGRRLVWTRARELPGFGVTSEGKARSSR